MNGRLQLLNDIVALGELLIDFTESGFSENLGKLFEQNPGGAPANMLTAATRLGSTTSFIGKVGKDMHGAFLKKTLIDAGIDVKGLIEDENVFTTLAFVALSESGEREFSFARKPGADTCLRSEEVDYDLIKNSKVFHFGSLSLTDEPVREATQNALMCAKNNGVVVTYDPNYRASLWPDEQTAIKMMKKHLTEVDILKVADNELEMLTGEKDIQSGVKKLELQGVKCIAVTLGEDGAFISVSGRNERIRVPKVPVVDTTGAGDAFFGGFINRFLKSGMKVNDISLEDATGFAYYGNATAALCVGKRGAIPAMPSFSEVENFVKANYV